MNTPTAPDSDETTPGKRGAGPGRDLALAETMPGAVAPLAAAGELGEANLDPASDSPLTAADDARYAAEALLGIGGMGEVRLHKDRHIGRHVAVKRLREARREITSRRRFLREARVQAQLEHPAIVPVYDIGVDGEGRPWFTMKRIRGETLAQIIAQLGAGDAATVAHHPRRRLLSAFASVCLAVHYAHTRGVLHRDLKPGNIMLGDFGEVYVLDWGIARLLADAGEPTADGAPARVEVTAEEAADALTQQGALVGTTVYMSPEQMAGVAERIDARSDVYALGLILYELLTLRRFFRERETPRADRDGAARPSLIDAETPPELDAICARATLPDPARRFPDARQLAEAVERFLDGDRDQSARRAAATHHAAAAQRSLVSSHGEGGATARGEAVREVMRALALDPANPDAQRLLVDLVTDMPETLPAEVQAEMAQAFQRQRIEGARFAAKGYLSWLFTLPLVLFAGVTAWPALGSGYLLTAVAAAFSVVCVRQRRFATREVIVLALLTAGIVAATAAYLGPFVLPPMCAAPAAIVFTMYATRRERPIFAGLVALGVLVPFVVELAGLMTPAVGFEADRVVLFARSVRVPRTLTLLGLAYVGVSFVVLPALFFGRVHDALERARCQLFVQAWHLRQLFPEAARGGRAVS